MITPETAYMTGKNRDARFQLSSTAATSDTTVSPSSKPGTRVR
jgi:hypothetical protein